MKITLILCCVAVAISFVIADNYSIDESFFDKVGLNRECYGNQTFKSYSLCDKRCDQAESAEDCPDVTYVVTQQVKRQTNM
ncbi:hypothetical protein CEXT_49011 [Caerostris extrusa]|uniref:Uncharacterized protein n=1 Tax=Caerostris extrusa TaxID=172846 RepID=A0AAV4WKC0_CAEEX|nr:hypothetical protein CEXT_49011 [Caerostris extrusa]